MPRWLYALVIALPLAFGARLLGMPPLLIFILSALALVPLAGLISVSTERLANYVGEHLGGLLNATFGNAAELIVGITALTAGLPDVVRASISGSIIGNALLVLGSAMLLGGWRHGAQRFSPRIAGQYATMLAIAVVGLVIPSIVATVGQQANAQVGAVSALSEHTLSVIVALVLLGSYTCYIAFSVFGVRAGEDAVGWAASAEEAIGGSGQASEGPGTGEVWPWRDRDETATETEKGAEEWAGRAHGVGGAEVGERGERTQDGGHARAERGVKVVQPQGDGAWQRGMRWLSGSMWGAAMGLGVATALTAVASELLVSAIEPVADEVGLSQFFIGLIVLPIVGNAAEHTSAISAALRDRMEIGMAITAGSSIQVALLVAPVLVLVGWVIKIPLDLDFNGLELVIFALVAGLYALVSLDGESTWLEGAQLIAFYVIVAASAFFIPT